MRNVYLYGALGAEFGRNHRFSIESIPEAIQALCANYPAFSEKLRRGFYKVVAGKTQDDGLVMTEASVANFRLGNQDLHIVPVAEGRGNSGGIGKILAGILLIGLAMIPGGAALMAVPLGASTIGGVVTSLGTSMILGGVAMLISPEKNSDSDENKSFTMSGPQTSLREGGIVPIVYGEVHVGGTMISASLNIETSGINGGGGGK